MPLSESVATKAMSAASALRVKSVLNPALWLVGITLPICFIAAYAFREFPVILYGSFGLGVTVVLLAVVAFIYFAITSPEKLQSEDYQIRHQMLQLVQEQDGVIELDPSTVGRIINPDAPAITLKESSQ